MLLATGRSSLLTSAYGVPTARGGSCPQLLRESDQPQLPGAGAGALGAAVGTTRAEGVEVVGGKPD